MKIITDLKQLNIKEPAVITIGCFDGVHLAHKEILTLTRQEALNIKGVSVVITFANHPQLYLHPQDTDFGVLCDEQDKMNHIADTGIDYCVNIPFNQKIADLKYTDFIHALQKRINIQAMVMGKDHGIGYRREGNLKKLMAMTKTDHINIIVANNVKINGEKVSSTAIRNKIAEGDIAGANAMLGYNYSMRVYAGTGLGKFYRFMFTTPHILTPHDKILYNVSMEGKQMKAYTDLFYIYVEDKLCKKVDKSIITFIG